MNNNNSTTINGGTNNGNQFATGSTEFKGVVNNIGTPELKKLEDLTESLILALKAESNQINDVEEITDAIIQVREASNKETVNKLSLNGMLSGINIVMSNVNGISTSTNQLYQDWYGHITSLFS